MEESKKVYLYEVQGLRALAALLVAIYHIWFQRVSGGVDVFFVVAAFFMALSLTKNSHLNLSSVNRYYMNTLRRVLPSTVIVIVVSVFGLLILSPNVVWRGEITNAIGASLFVENLVLASKSSNYLDQGLNSSVFQQMWAISIQMQLYFIIPIIIYVTSLFSVSRGSALKKNLLNVFIFIFITSLIYSVIRTHIDQAFTYYDTFARLWEFSVGILLALLLPKLKLKKTPSLLLGLTGLMVLVSFAAVFDVSTQFPGYLALVPCLAACAIIISSANGSKLPFLSSDLLVKLGDYSFGFYLWHWPLLSLYRQFFAINEISFVAGLCIIIIALFLSYVSTKLVEKPFRKNEIFITSAYKTLGASIGLVALALISVLFLTFNWKSASSEAVNELASFLKSNSQVNHLSIFPDPIIARSDLPVAYKDGCHQSLDGDEVISCLYGNESFSKTIVLAGGSHALQWLPALIVMGEEYGFNVVSMTKSGCVLSRSDPGLKQSKAHIHSCMNWNEYVVGEIIKVKPLAVFTIGSRVVGGVESVPRGYIDAWDELDKNDINVIALRDNPWLSFDAPSCVGVSKDTGKCFIKRSSFYSDINPINRAVSNNIYALDLSDLFCNDICPVVIGNVLVYRDKHHLTRTFVIQSRHVLKNVLKDVDLISF